MTKKLFKFLLFVILLLSIYICVIYLFQDKFLFQPDTLYKSPQMINLPLFKEIPVTMKDGTDIMTWYFEGALDKPVFMFFHGNSGQIAKFAPAMEDFAKLGYSVIMMEYRGFGETQSEITQENAFSDACRIYDYYKNKINNNKIIVYGYSFGCAVAMGLTQYRQVDGIILTAPFLSFYQEVKDKFIPFAEYLLKDIYPSDVYMREVSVPVLIVHGTDDKLISYKHSEKLYNLAPVKDKKLVLADGVNHHNIFFLKENIPAILDWLEEHFN